MSFSLSPIESYEKYLEDIGTQLKVADLDQVKRRFEDTSWDDPQSSLECNNVAVLACIEAERSAELDLRQFYLEFAAEVLQYGIETDNNLLCLAHWAVVLSLSGQKNVAIDRAFAGLQLTLNSSLQEARSPLGLVYIPPTNRFRDRRGEYISLLLSQSQSEAQAQLLFANILHWSQLVFYGGVGSRFLNLATHLMPHSADLQLQLGLSKFYNHQTEGLIHLFQARKLAPDRGEILQSIYLAYRDLGQISTARSLQEQGRRQKQQNPQALDWQWVDLELDSPFTYVAFESSILMSVEATLGSIVTLVLLAQGDWFESEMEYWRQRIQPGMTVIDVGANAGVYTFSAALQAGNTGRVFAIEPFSGCIQCLTQTRELNEFKQVSVLRRAAGNCQGTARLHLNRSSELNKVLTESDPSKNGTSEEVEYTKLDDLAEEFEFQRLDLIKLDVEGHEIQVLEGARKLLELYKPTILYENIAGVKGSNTAVREWFLNHNYQLFRYRSSFLPELIPIQPEDNLNATLNIIAVPDANTSLG